MKIITFEHIIVIGPFLSQELFKVAGNWNPIPKQVWPLLLDSIEEDSIDKLMKKITFEYVIVIGPFLSKELNVLEIDSKAGLIVNSFEKEAVDKIMKVTTFDLVIVTCRVKWRVI